MSIQTDIKLTESQSIALISMKHFVNESNNRSRFFRLTGYAGTGKTFVICQFIKWLIENQFQIAVASPTNKAAKNLQAMAWENQLGIDVITVAKLLGQQVELDEKAGKEIFVSKKGNAIADSDVIIIDEFSMINKNNFADIYNSVYYDSPKTKVIFVGDGAQLPPVNEKESVILNHPNIKESANLTEVVRYDGELAKVAETIRSHRQYNQILYPFTSSEDGSIVCLERHEWLQQAAKLFCSSEFLDNPNLVRFLTWRNKQSDVLNAYVRKAIWDSGFTVDTPMRLYERDDLLIAKSPAFRQVTVMNSKGKPKKEWQIIINSSEECRVTDEINLLLDDTYGWEYYSVSVLTDDGLNFKLRILTEGGNEQRQKCLDKLKKQKQWRKYYDLLKAFDNISHAYSITTHKAQGSSIDYVFADIYDIQDCYDLQKILYTAVTRTKKTLFVPVYV